MKFNSNIEFNFRFRVVLIHLIPCILLIVFNCLLFKGLKEVKKRKSMKRMGSSLVSRSCSVLRLFSMKRETKEKPKTSFERPKCLRSDSSDEVTQRSEWEGWLRTRRRGLRGIVVGKTEPKTRSSAWLQPERHVCQRGANNVTRWEFSTYEKDARYGGFPRWSPPSHGLSRSKGWVP